MGAGEGVAQRLRLRAGIGADAVTLCGFALGAAFTVAAWPSAEVLNDLAKTIDGKVGDDPSTSWTAKR